MYVLIAQSCLTLCNATDCSLPRSSVHGILQARILEWVASFFSRNMCIGLTGSLCYMPKTNATLKWTIIQNFKEIEKKKEKLRLEALSSHRRSRCSKSIGIWWDLQALSSRANKGTQEIHRCAEPSVHWLIPSHLLIISATLSTSGLTLKQRTNRLRGFPGGARGKEPTCQHRRLKRHGYDPWVRKTP